MLWICSYPVSKKELFLKSTVPKKHAESLKTIWKELRFYGIYISQVFTNGLAKTSIPRPCMWNSKKPYNQSFWIFLSSSMYDSPPFMFSNFRSTFFLQIPPSGCFC